MSIQGWFPLALTGLISLLSKELKILAPQVKSLNSSMLNLFNFSSVQSLSHVQLFVIPWTTARQASLSITNSQSLPKPMSIELVMPSNHLILCRPLLLLSSVTFYFSHMLPSCTLTSLIQHLLVEDSNNSIIHLWYKQFHRKWCIYSIYPHLQPATQTHTSLARVLQKEK